MLPPSPALLLLIGFIAGIAAGLFGIGGGVLIVPALVYLAGFPLHTAVGTSLAILLPPVGLAAVLTYYRYGQGHLMTTFEPDIPESGHTIEVCRQTGGFPDCGPEEHRC